MRLHLIASAKTNKNMITILIGTKAQVVKMAPVMKELSVRSIPYRFVLTGQHTETMDDLISAFNIRKADDVLVNIGESDTEIKLLKWLMLAIKSVRERDYFKKNTKVILVHGDTLSTLFGAVVGRIYSIPVAHVEAGLRSFNYFHPFPEEIVRVLTSKLADIHYCSSDWAKNNLKHLSADSEIISTEENTILDSLRYAINSSSGEVQQQAYGVLSMHRHENISDSSRFNHILKVLIKIAELINMKFILHPVTKNKLLKSGWYERLSALENIELQNRMNYVDFSKLLAGSRFLLTDGGSNQEEAYHMGLPCLLLREKTERQEGLDENVIISNYDADTIMSFVRNNIKNKWELKKITGKSPSKAIVDHLISL